MDSGAGLSVMSSRYKPGLDEGRAWEIGLLYEEDVADGSVLTASIRNQQSDPYGWLNALYSSGYLSRSATSIRQSLSKDATALFFDMMLKRQKKLMNEGKY